MKKVRIWLQVVLFLAIVAAAVVIFILPSMLMVFDKVICVTTREMHPKKEKLKTAVSS